jgi:Uma2 family endonuclease
VDDEKYTLLSSETGIHLNKYNNLAGDILIFENSVLPIEAIDEHYATVPPKVAIEVDINIEAPGLEIDSYIFNKTQKLLNFGVEKVIWITTKSKKVTVATKNEDWQVKDWNKDIEVFDGIIFNIGEYLRKKGSSFA